MAVVVESVERVEVDWSTSGNNASIPLPGKVLDDLFVFPITQYNDGDDEYANFKIRADLIDDGGTPTLEVIREDTGDFTNVNVPVVEISGVAQVQRGTISLSTSATTTITINAVNLSNAFILYNYSCSNTQSRINEMYLRVYLSSSTEITIDATLTAGIGAQLNWVVLEDPDFNVQHFTGSLTSGQALADVTIAAAAQQNTMIFGSFATSAMQGDERLTAFRQTSATNVQVIRNNGDSSGIASSSLYAFQVITSSIFDVQSGSITSPSTTTSGTVTINSLPDLSLAIVTGTTPFGSGHVAGTTGFHRAFGLRGLTATSFTWQRDSHGSTWYMEWQVIQFQIAGDIVSLDPLDEQTDLDNITVIELGAEVVVLDQLVEQSTLRSLAVIGPLAGYSGADFLSMEGVVDSTIIPTETFAPVPTDKQFFASAVGGQAPSGLVSSGSDKRMLLLAYAAGWGSAGAPPTSRWTEQIGASFVPIVGTTIQRHSFFGGQAGSGVSFVLVEPGGAGKVYQFEAGNTEFDEDFELTAGAAINAIVLDDRTRAIQAVNAAAFSMNPTLAAGSSALTLDQTVSARPIDSATFALASDIITVTPQGSYGIFLCLFRLQFTDGGSSFVAQDYEIRLEVERTGGSSWENVTTAGFDPFFPSSLPGGGGAVGHAMVVLLPNDRVRLTALAEDTGDGREVAEQGVSLLMIELPGQTRVASLTRDTIGTENDDPVSFESVVVQTNGFDIDLVTSPRDLTVQDSGYYWVLSQGSTLSFGSSESPDATIQIDGTQVANTFAGQVGTGNFDPLSVSHTGIRNVTAGQALQYYYSGDFNGPYPDTNFTAVLLDTLVGDDIVALDALAEESAFLDIAVVENGAAVIVLDALPGEASELADLLAISPFQGPSHGFIYTENSGTSLTAPSGWQAIDMDVEGTSSDTVSTVISALDDNDWLVDNDGGLTLLLGGIQGVTDVSYELWEGRLEENTGGGFAGISQSVATAFSDAAGSGSVGHLTTFAIVDSAFGTQYRMAGQYPSGSVLDVQDSYLSLINIKNATDVYWVTNLSDSSSTPDNAAIPLDQELRSSANFSLASNEITVGGTGTRDFLLLFRLSTNLTTGNGDEQLQYRVELDTGGGYSTLQDIYTHSGFNDGGQGMSAIFIQPLSAGDKLRVFGVTMEAITIPAGQVQIALIELPPTYVGISAYSDVQDGFNAFTPVTMPTERVKNGITHDTVTNTDQFTIDTDGTYLVSGSALGFDGSATGSVSGRVIINNTTYIPPTFLVQSGYANGDLKMVSFNTLVELTAGDVLTVEQAGSSSTTNMPAQTSNLTILSLTGLEWPTVGPVFSDVAADVVGSTAISAALQALAGLSADVVGATAISAPLQALVGLSADVVGETVISADLTILVGTSTYAQAIVDLGAEHHWPFDGSNIDIIGGVTGTASGQSFATAALAKEATNSMQMTGLTSRYTADPEGTINLLPFAAYSFGGWFQAAEFFTFPTAIAGRGDGSASMRFIMFMGNAVMVESDNGSTIVQAFGDTFLEPGRPYHLYVVWQGSGLGNILEFYIDGLLQSVTEPPSGAPGSATFPSGAQFEYGNPLSSTSVGGTLVTLNAPTSSQWQHWTLSSGNLLTDIPTATEVREVLFGQSVVSDVVISTDTQANMQIALDALSGTTRPDAPSCIEIEAEAGGSDFELTVNNITFDALASLHINYTGSQGTLTLRNAGGSNTSIVLAPYPFASVVILATVTVQVTVLDASTQLPIQDAVVLLEADVGGPAAAGEDIISALVTDVNGQVSVIFDYTADQPVTGRARKGTASPFYKTGTLGGTITATGYDVTIFLVGDE